MPICTVSEAWFIYWYDASFPLTFCHQLVNTVAIQWQHTAAHNTMKAFARGSQTNISRVSEQSRLKSSKMLSLKVQKESEIVIEETEIVICNKHISLKWLSSIISLHWCSLSSHYKGKVREQVTLLCNIRSTRTQTLMARGSGNPYPLLWVEGKQEITSEICRDAARWFIHCFKLFS